MVEISILRIQGNGRREVCYCPLKIAHAIFGDATIVVSKAVGRVNFQCAGVVNYSLVILTKLQHQGRHDSLSVAAASIIIVDCGTCWDGIVDMQA